MQKIESKEFGMCQSKVDTMFDRLNTFPDLAEYADYMCPPVEAAIVDTSMYKALQQAALPKRKNDCVKYLSSSWLDSLFQQPRVPKI